MFPSFSISLFLVWVIQLFKSVYAKNVLTLMTGTAVAQLIPVLLLPVLTRLYTPMEFGVYALYVSICSIFAVVITGRYELAIIVPEKDRDAFCLLVLSAALSVIVSTVLFFIIVTCGDFLLKLFGIYDELKGFVYFLPVSILAMGLLQTINYWFNRNKLFKEMALTRGAQSIGNISAQISLGYIGLFGGQVYGFLFAQIAVFFLLIRKIALNNFQKFATVTRTDLLLVANKFSSFPKYLVPSHLINIVSSQSPVIVLSVFFSAQLTGYYLLVERLLSLPISLIASAMGEVFRQQASETFVKSGQCRDIFLVTFKKLFSLALLPFVIMFFVVDDAIELFFGENWSIAGEYAKILLPMFFSRFVTSPISQVAIIVKKPKIDLLWQIALLISIGCAVVLGVISNSVLVFLWSYSIGYCVMFWISFFINFRLSKGE